MPQKKRERKNRKAHTYLHADILDILRYFISNQFVSNTRLKYTNLYVITYKSIQNKTYSIMIDNTIAPRGHIITTLHQAKIIAHRRVSGHASMQRLRRTTERSSHLVPIRMSEPLISGAISALMGVEPLPTLIPNAGDRINNISLRSRRYAGREMPSCTNTPERDVARSVQHRCCTRGPQVRHK